MVSNEELAEKMDHLMAYYRDKSMFEKSAAFSKASTKLKKINKPVAGIPEERLQKSSYFEDVAVKKIREYIETGKVSEFEQNE